MFGSPSSALKPVSTEIPIVLISFLQISLTTCLWEHDNNFTERLPNMTWEKVQSIHPFLLQKT